MYDVGAVARVDVLCVMCCCYLLMLVYMLPCLSDDDLTGRISLKGFIVTMSNFSPESSKDEKVKCNTTQHTQQRHSEQKPRVHNMSTGCRMCQVPRADPDAHATRMDVYVRVLVCLVSLISSRLPSVRC